MLIPVAVVLVAVLAYAVPSIALAGKVPPGTKVGGVNIGGLSPEAARSRLEAELGKRVHQPLTMIAAGKRRDATSSGAAEAWTHTGPRRCGTDRENGLYGRSHLRRAGCPGDASEYHRR
ncbi:hypothetical protein GCM10020216_079730 [Nonomuraea helvata]